MGSTSLLTYKDVAHLTKCSVSNVRRWVAAKQIPVITLGANTRRIKSEDLDAFIRRQTTKAKLLS
jgi:excisionase family DNA binding protein